MALQRRAILFLSVALAVIPACGEDRPELGPPSACKNGDPGCSDGVGYGVGSGVGSGAGGTGGQGTGGQTASGDLIGTVSVISDTAFETTAPYAGVASVLALTESSVSVAADYDGQNPFRLEGLPAGNVWVLVDASAADDVLDAITLHQVPDSAADVSLVAREVLDSIAATLAGVSVIDPTRAQIVVRVVRDGQPLAGVSLVGAALGATVAYDQGAGSYSDIASATGVAGGILLLGASASSSVGFISLTVQDDVGTAVTLEIPVTNGAVTVAGFEI